MYALEHPLYAVAVQFILHVVVAEAAHDEGLELGCPEVVGPVEDGTGVGVVYEHGDERLLQQVFQRRDYRLVHLETNKQTS